MPSPAPVARVSRRAVLAAAGLLVVSAPGLAPAKPVTAHASLIRALLGRWQVDLRPAPDAPPYLQRFEVTTVDADSGSFEGSFYETPIEWARANVAWGELLIGFVTSDAAGPYHHSAVLRQDAEGAWLDGRSQHVGRKLLTPWRAQRTA